MINKNYFNPESLKQIGTHLGNSEPKLLLLNEFLNHKYFDKLRKELKKSKWTKACEPDRFSYSESLPKFVQEIFLSSEFVFFIESVFGMKLNSVSLRAKKFSWKDYTLVHDGFSDEKKKGFVFFVAEKWKNEFGGQVIFVDKKSENYVFVPKGNSILFFDKSKGMNDFVKYINNHAKKESFVLIEFLVG